MPTTPPTRRRWFQFGLGTMFLLVTAFAVWLGWELNYIRERQAWMRDNAALVGNVVALAPTNLGAFISSPFGGPLPQPLPKVVIDEESGVVSFLPVIPPVASPPRNGSIPLWRKWLGDEPVTGIFEGDDWTDADRRNVRRLFPEAELFPYGDRI